MKIVLFHSLELPVSWEELEQLLIEYCEHPTYEQGKFYIESGINTFFFFHDPFIESPGLFHKVGCINLLSSYSENKPPINVRILFDGNELVEVGKVRNMISSLRISADEMAQKKQNKIVDGAPPQSGIEKKEQPVNEAEVIKKPSVKLDVYLPTRFGDLVKWKQLWSLKINSWVNKQGMSAKNVIENLKNEKAQSRYKGWIPGIDTMRKIITAGINGKLD